MIRMTASTPRIKRLMAAAIAVMVCANVSASGVWAQTAAPPPQQTPEPPAEKKNDSPGLINDISRLLGKSVDLFPSLKLTPADPASPSAPTAPGDTVTSAPIPDVAPSPAPSAGPSLPPAAPTPPPAVAAPANPALIPKMVTGRAVCPIAGNGAPDCKAGADALCKTKGMTSGRSLDMDSAHNCSTQNLMAGARSIKDICRTETFVTRAMCQ
jgi:hypothetical protein